MKNIKNKSLKKFAPAFSAFMLSFLAITCVFLRVMECAPDYSDAMVFAAKLSLPAGETNLDKEENAADADVQNSDNTAGSNNQKEEVSSENSDNKQKASVGADISEPTKEELAEYDKEHEGENKYEVYETNITANGEKYNNFYVKQNASEKIDIGEELGEKLGFTPEETDKPQVLIVHTHTCEGYLKYDTGYYYESYYPRTTDNSENVCAVGEEITKSLNSHGIVAIHDTTQHDSPSYNGAYDRSMETIQKYLKKYPSIKVVLDIHRDAFSTDEEGAMKKPVFTTPDGKKAAQIMIMAGCDIDGVRDFPDWRYNLRFALQLQQKAETLYPGMTRPLNYGDFVYNMNANTGSLLIEVGTDGNSLNEVKLTGSLLGNAIAETLGDNLEPGDIR